MEIEQQLGGPLAEFLADRIPKAAAIGNRRFPMVPAEDFEQEMWLRVLAHPDKFRRLLADGREGIVWEELRRAATRLGNEDDRYRRAVKAARAGYRIDDEQFYSAAIIRPALELLVDADMDPAGAYARTISGTDYAGVHITVSDPDHSGTLETVLIDVATAFRRIRRHDQRLLITYYGVRQDDSQQGRWERQGLASSMGLTYEALKTKASRAITALQRELGGSSPWRQKDLPADQA